MRGSLGHVYAGYRPLSRLQIRTSLSARCYRSPRHAHGAGTDDWDFDQIIVGHGTVVENNGKEVFRTAFRWFLK